MIFKPSNVLLASFFASNFLYENKSRQQREFVSVRVFLPLKKRESFRIMYVQQHFFVIYLGCLGRQQTQNPKRFKFNSEAASVSLESRNLFSYSNLAKYLNGYSPYFHILSICTFTLFFSLVFHSREPS